MAETDPMAVGLAGGVTWAIGIVTLGVGSMFVSSWQPLMNWFSQFYVGYASSFSGVLIGAVWGFLDAFIPLYIFFWLYNYFRENL